jgi:hypothetical protein
MFSNTLRKNSTENFHILNRLKKKEKEHAGMLQENGESERIKVY